MQHCTTLAKMIRPILVAQFRLGVNETNLKNQLNLILVGLAKKDEITDDALRLYRLVKQEPFDAQNVADAFDSANRITVLAYDFAGARLMIKRKTVKQIESLEPSNPDEVNNARAKALTRLQLFVQLLMKHFPPPKVGKTLASNLQKTTFNAAKEALKSITAGIITQHDADQAPVVNLFWNEVWQIVRDTSIQDHQLFLGQASDLLMKLFSWDAEPVPIYEPLRISAADLESTNTKLQENRAAPPLAAINGPNNQIAPLPASNTSVAQRARSPVLQPLPRSPSVIAQQNQQRAESIQRRTAALPQPAEPEPDSLLRQFIIKERVHWTQDESEFQKDVAHITSLEVTPGPDDEDNGFTKMLADDPELAEIVKANDEFVSKLTNWNSNASNATKADVVEKQFKDATDRELIVYDLAQIAVSIDNEFDNEIKQRPENIDAKDRSRAILQEVGKLVQKLARVFPASGIDTRLALTAYGKNKAQLEKFLNARISNEKLEGAATFWFGMKQIIFVVKKDERPDLPLYVSYASQRINELFSMGQDGWQPYSSPARFSAAQYAVEINDEQYLAAMSSGSTSNARIDSSEYSDGFEPRATAEPSNLNADNLERLQNVDPALASGDAPASADGFNMANAPVPTEALTSASQDEVQQVQNAPGSSSVQQVPDTPSPQNAPAPAPSSFSLRNLFSFGAAQQTGVTQATAQQQLDQQQQTQPRSEPSTPEPDPEAPQSAPAEISLAQMQHALAYAIAVW